MKDSRGGSPTLIPVLGFWHPQLEVPPCYNLRILAHCTSKVLDFADSFFCLNRLKAFGPGSFLDSCFAVEYNRCVTLGAAGHLPDAIVWLDSMQSGCSR